MNYLNLSSSYPDPTIAAAWDSQAKEADKTPWLADTLTEVGASCLRALRRATRSCAPYPVASGAPFSANLRAPAGWQQSCRNTCSRADDDCSIGWLGLWPTLPYCWPWVREWRRRQRSPSTPTTTRQRSLTAPRAAGRTRLCCRQTPM